MSVCLPAKYNKNDTEMLSVNKDPFAHYKYPLIYNTCEDCDCEVTEATFRLFRHMQRRDGGQRMLIMELSGKM